MHLVMAILWDRMQDYMGYWENEAIVRKQKYCERFLVGLGSHTLFQSVREKQQQPVLPIISAHSSTFIFIYDNLESRCYTTGLS